MGLAAAARREHALLHCHRHAPQSTSTCGAKSRPPRVAEAARVKTGASSPAWHVRRGPPRTGLLLKKARFSIRHCYLPSSVHGLCACSGQRRTHCAKRLRKAWESAPPSFRSRPNILIQGAAALHPDGAQHAVIVNRSYVVFCESARILACATRAARRLKSKG